jgi:hypothetical protein
MKDLSFYSKKSVLLLSGLTGLLLLSPIYESFAQGYSQGNGNIENIEIERDYQYGKSQNKSLNTFDTTQSISTFEKEALEKMGEEEFLARDVYLVLYEKWNLQIFSNISKSEQKHADEIIELTNAYGLSNFSGHEAGVFEDYELQNLYNDLVTKGLSSEIEALKIGATIEDLDIYDLELFLKSTQNPDIKKVFENLNRGSRNHMRAFISQLEKRNDSYTPIYITEERFLDIINGEHEKGQNANGGNGNKGQDANGGNGKKGQNANGGNGKKGQNANGGNGKKGQNANGGNGNKGQNANGGNGKKGQNANGGNGKKGQNANGGNGNKGQNANGGNGKKGQNANGGNGNEEKSFMNWFKSFFLN